MADMVRIVEVELATGWRVASTERSRLDAALEAVRLESLGHNVRIGHVPASEMEGLMWAPSTEWETS